MSQPPPTYGPWPPETSMATFLDKTVGAVFHDDTEELTKNPMIASKYKKVAKIVDMEGFLKATMATHQAALAAALDPLEVPGMVQMLLRYAGGGGVPHIPPDEKAPEGVYAPVRHARDQHTSSAVAAAVAAAAFTAAAVTTVAVATAITIAAAVATLATLAAAFAAAALAAAATHTADAHVHLLVVLPRHARPATTVLPRRLLTSTRTRTRCFLYAAQGQKPSSPQQRRHALGEWVLAQQTTPPTSWRLCAIRRSHRKRLSCPSGLW